MVFVSKMELMSKKIRIEHFLFSKIERYGNAKESRNLDHCYKYGIGVEKDEKKGISSISKIC